MTISWRILNYETTDSTNLEAKRLIQQGAGHGTVILAETQTAGKGRLGRVWESAQGAGIWFSVILEPDIPLQQMSLYSFAAAVAVAEGIQDAAGIDSQVKWPNDVLCGGKKVCGILLELVAERNCSPKIIIGIGINANQKMADFPEEVRTKATSIAMETGCVTDRQKVLEAVLKRIQQASEQLEQTGFEPIRNRWMERSCVTGKPVQILQQGKAILYGTVQGLADDGALLIQTDQGMERITAGDVSLRAEDGSYAR